MKFTTQIKTNICEKLENITENLTKISFHFQFVIAQGDEGIMVLLKRSYLIDIINDHREEKVKVTVRFFNLGRLCNTHNEENRDRNKYHGKYFISCEGKKKNNL